MSIPLWHTAGHLHCYREVRVGLLSGSGNSMTLCKEPVLARTRYANIHIVHVLQMGNCSNHFKQLKVLDHARRGITAQLQYEVAYLCSRLERRKTHSA